MKIKPSPAPDYTSEFFVNSPTNFTPKKDTIVCQLISDQVFVLSHISYHKARQNLGNDTKIKYGDRGLLEFFTTKKHFSSHEWAKKIKDHDHAFLLIKDIWYYTNYKQGIFGEKAEVTGDENNERLKGY